MRYHSRKSMDMELSDSLASDAEFELSPVLAVVFLVVLVFLLTVVK
ncbi:MAG: hypothetical protein WC742_14890 [Gallionellaceae bacterium]